MSDALRALGLPQHVANFASEEVELGVMQECMRRQGRAAVDDLLRELGVEAMGQRVAILNALAA